MSSRTLGTKFSVAVAALSLPVLLVIELEWTDGLVIRLPGAAHAVVGAPMTPMSVAGVARRTTYRVVAAETATVAAAGAAQQQAVAQQQAATAKQQQATAQQQAAIAQQQAAIQQNAGGALAIGTVVAALPAGCAAEAYGGVEYYRCGNSYYRAAFQSNNLVYVVQPKP